MPTKPTRPLGHPERSHIWHAVLANKEYGYADPPDPSRWVEAETWSSETLVMPAACKPLSFLVNRPLARREASVVASSETVVPRSVPSAKYLQPRAKPDPYEKLAELGIVKWIDGRKHMELDGKWIPMHYEPHPGKQSWREYPKPVPGVTKKEKGRKPATVKTGPKKNGYTYTCKAEGCGKIFGRSEHLKRHIRSVHTHETPYMCALPFCDKAFARRDNLLQHERKHKHYQAMFDCTANFAGKLRPEYLPHLDESVAKTRENIAMLASMLPPEYHYLLPEPVDDPSYNPEAGHIATDSNSAAELSGPGHPADPATAGPSGVCRSLIPVNDDAVSPFPLDDLLQIPDASPWSP
ncbi:hypothetical protein WOLCODRAFT_135696 [Wolfiporia cocos MD-104 SS10]|uniref:C2H2-type domain-containing protein n=1 Tax=Wolfiporia cocos (strain MD-104) TaxID=742152 RepID=A0A2H3J3P6_WOLCO|nr:hypothetical protein WOLCODRAFT_135696 [Wolfiporia cocos MD-104 SS10]